MLNVEQNNLAPIIEALLLAASKPLNLETLQQLLAVYEPSKENIEQALRLLQQDCVNRGIELIEVASGYRYQTRKELSAIIAGLYPEKPQNLTRPQKETLAVIIYRQPVTRGEIESYRGVSVSSSIFKFFDDNGWIRVVGQRDVPGKPNLYATTKKLLDDFGCTKLEDFPSFSIEHEEVTT